MVWKRAILGCVSQFEGLSIDVVDLAKKEGSNVTRACLFFLHYLGETGSFQSGRSKISRHYFAFVFVFVFLLSWETGPFRIGQLKISRHYFVFVFFSFFLLCIIPYLARDSCKK